MSQLSSYLYAIGYYRAAKLPFATIVLFSLCRLPPLVRRLKRHSNIHCSRFHRSPGSVQVAIPETA